VVGEWWGEVLSVVEGGISWEGNAVNEGGRIGRSRWVRLAHRLRQRVT